MVLIQCYTAKPPNKVDRLQCYTAKPPNKVDRPRISFGFSYLKLLLFKPKQVWAVCAEIEYPRGRVGVCETDFLIAALPSVYRNVDFKCLGRLKQIPREIL